MSKNNEIAIKVSNLSKSFSLPHEKSTSVKSLVTSPFKRRTFEKQEVLKDINFEIKKGEFFGIVGKNGSGKSTLLKLIAGIYSPNKGNIQINGKLTPFIELGVGFNPELTGRENVFLNGALLGFNRKEMTSMYQEIVDFAEIEKFMDQKLKNYSSGMQVRLAFSIAIRAKSDILLLDEVLAVGDAAFQTKCFNYFQELKRKKTTVVFISHDRGALERFCKYGALIDEGRMVIEGDMKKVLNRYSEIVLKEISRDNDSSKGSENKQKLKKSSVATIEDIRTHDVEGLKAVKYKFGDKISVSFKVKLLEDIKNPVLGITLWKKNSSEAIFATNTLIEGITKTGIFKKNENILFRAKLPRYLNDGEYRIEAAIANEAATIILDQSEGMKFYISGSSNPHALISSDFSIMLKKEN